MRKIAHAPQQPASDPWRSARTTRDLASTVIRQIGSEQARRTAHHLLQLLDSVEVEPDGNAEAIAERRREQALARRCSDEREARKIDTNRTGRWALADHQVERAVLHRRIKNFLYGGV